MRQFTTRLKEGSDLRKGIEELAKENLIKAGVIVSAVGGLLPANVRMPGAKVNRTWNEPVEIVSITGTLSEMDSHIHISFSDIDGVVYGGHLNEGCIVRNTAEIVVLAFDDVKYVRESDPSTGYKELIVKKKNG